MTIRSRLRPAALGLLLSVMTLAAYAPALQSGYIWDDDDYVTENRLLDEPDGLGRIWFSMDAPSQYVPMVYTAFRIEYGLWGLDPFGYHLVNVLLHALNALLLWWFLSRLQIPAAWLVAAVFALHPVHVESVAWISERKNLLSLMFSLMSMIAWLRFTDTAPQARRVFYLVSLGFYSLALLSKATACTLPAAALLLPWMRGQRIDRRLLMQIVPFIVLGIGMGLVAIFWERFHIGTHGERFGLAFAESVLVASRACFFYLQKLAWPTQLAFSYPRFEIDPADPLQYAWLLAGGLLLSLLWLQRQRIGREPLVAALFFIATLSPVLGFIPLYTFWYTFVADHYQYVASIGPIALFVAGAAYAFRSWELDLRIRVAVAVSALVVLGGLTFEQARVYENREILWRDTIAKNPRSWMAYTNLGRYFLEEYRWQDAIEAYDSALRIRPETYRAHVGLALAMGGLGRKEDEVRQYEAALTIEPNLPAIHGDLARLAWQRGDAEAGIRHSKARVLLSPENSHAYLFLGRGLERIGRLLEAQSQYQRALAIDPDSGAAQRALLRLRSGAELPARSSTASDPDS